MKENKIIIGDYTITHAYDKYRTYPHRYTVTFKDVCLDLHAYYTLTEAKNAIKLHAENYLSSCPKCTKND